MKILMIMISLTWLNSCSTETQANEIGASCESAYVGDGERVKICKMPDGATCYMYEGQGISCLPLP